MKMVFLSTTCGEKYVRMFYDTLKINKIPLTAKIVIYCDDSDFELVDTLNKKTGYNVFHFKTPGKGIFLDQVINLVDFSSKAKDKVICAFDTGVIFDWVGVCEQLNRKEDSFINGKLKVHSNRCVGEASKGRPLMLFMLAKNINPDFNKRLEDLLNAMEEMMSKHPEITNLYDRYSKRYPDKVKTRLTGEAVLHASFLNHLDDVFEYLDGEFIIPIPHHYFDSDRYKKAEHYVD